MRQRIIYALDAFESFIEANPTLTVVLLVVTGIVILSLIF